MNVLIGYDGSDCANVALEDLRRAGLPDEVQAIVIGIADVWEPPSEAQEGDTEFPEVEERRESARALVRKAESEAAAAARTLSSMFPAWTVASEAYPDSPAWGVIKRADEWPADVIVVGPHGMSGMDRLFIGSVSQKVLTHATCTVRVARRNVHQVSSPLRLLVGFDGSADAQVAVREVASRKWPEGTEAQLLCVMDHGVRSALMVRVLRVKPVDRSEPDAESGNPSLPELMQLAVEQLKAAGLQTTHAHPDGDPKRVLVETAKDWGAHCIFLGATGLRGLRRLLLGSVSSGVAAHAPCTVEIVRPSRSHA